MALKLYLDLHVQTCWSVNIFAKLANILFEYKAMDLSAGEHFGEEFGKISDVRKVPVGHNHMAALETDSKEANQHSSPST
ncbi:hypothetical protein AOLI_G00071790 [Acnodon oligacanthus]